MTKQCWQLLPAKHGCHPFLAKWGFKTDHLCTWCCQEYSWWLQGTGEHNEQERANLFFQSLEKRKHSIYIWSNGNHLTNHQKSIIQRKTKKKKTILCKSNFSSNYIPLRIPYLLRRREIGWIWRRWCERRRRRRRRGKMGRRGRGRHRRLIWWWWWLLLVWWWWLRWW